MKSRSGGRPPKSPSSPHMVLPIAASTRPANVSLEPSIPTSPSKQLTMKRISALYNELKVRDAKSIYPWRLLILVFLALMAVFTLHFLASGLFSLLPSVQVTMPTVGVYRRYEQIFYNDSDFAYIPEGEIFITTTAKAGSTTFWTWLHRGITGRENADGCNDTYIQDFPAPCWDGKVEHPFNFSNSKRWHIVNSPKVLRVAILRDPFERLISAWKSKAACDSDDFGTDVHDRDIMVPKLLRQAGMKRDASCLSLNSFAQVLDTLRLLSEQGKYHFKDMNKHFRPQEVHFADIKYNIVLDVSQLSNLTLVKPVIKRLKFSDRMAGPPKLLHASLRSPQTMSEITADALYKFALLTEQFPKPFSRFP